MTRMLPYDPDALVLPQVLELAPYQPGLSPDDVERQLGVRGAVKLASNENPLGPSPHALEAMRRAAAQVHRYPDADAVHLRHKLAALHGVATDELAFGHGSNELIALLCRTFADKEHHAVIGQPSFVAYRLSLQAAGVPFTEVPLRDHLYWDLDAVRAAMRPETRLCFLDNPNNPTSTHIPRAALARFLATAPPHVLVVVDEAYAPLVDTDDFASALTLRQQAACPMLVLRTFSKVHGLAAARVGYGISDRALIDFLGRVNVPFNLNSMAQAGAIAALDDEAHVTHYLALNAQERTRVTQRLQALGLQVAPSQTNFLCVRFGEPAAPIHAQLLRQGVIVRPLAPPLADALRISLGTPSENDRLLAALTAVRGPAMDSAATPP